MSKSLFPAVPYLLFAQFVLFGCGSPTAAPTAPDAPVRVTLPAEALTTEEDTPLRFELRAEVANASDDDFAIDVESGPEHGTLVQKNGRFSYTPAEDFNGADSFRALARAGDAKSEPVTITIAVIPVNDLPRAADDAYFVAEDTALSPTLSVLLNDTDADDDPLTASLLSNPAHGSVTMRTDGTFDYVPETDFFGTDSFSYRVRDGADSAEATVTITVQPVNDAPAITSAAVIGGYQRGVTAYAAVAGWSDVDGDVPAYLYRWTVDGVEVPVVGSVLPGSYAVKGAELKGFVTPFDGTTAGEEVATAPVTVLNTPPVATGGTYSVTAPNAITVTAGADADGDPVTAAVVAPPQNGSLVMQPLGVTVYTPVLGFVGTDVFSYRVSDGTALSGVAQVSVTVDPVPLDSTTPHRFSIVQGALPAFACNAAGAFAIVSMTPVTGTALQPDTLYDFTAVVSYAVKVTETVYLVAIDDGWHFTNPQPEEKVTLEPSAGCAQTTVTLHNVSTGSSNSLEIKLMAANHGSDEISGVAATYYIAGAPAVRIVGSDHDFNQPVTLDADGTVTLRFQVAWNNIPAGWGAPLQAYSPGLGNFTGSWFPISGTAGTATAEITVRPGACSDEYIVVGFGVANADWSLSSWEQVRLFFEMPDLLVKSDNVFVQSPMAPPQEHSVQVSNCTDDMLYVNAASGSPWLYPQAFSTAVAAGAKQAITYATDAQALDAAVYSGNLDLQTVEATVARYPVSLIVPGGSYVAVPTTIAWISEGVTSGTLVSSVGEDEINHPVELPFPFTYYGIAFDRLIVNTNGYVNFGVEGESDYNAVPLPVDTLPLGLYIAWYDLNPAAGQGIYTATLGEAPNRIFVVTWHDVGDYGDETTTRSAQLVLYEGSDAFLVQYESIQSSDVAGTNVGDGMTSISWIPWAGSAFLVSPN